MLGTELLIYDACYKALYAALTVSQGHQSKIERQGPVKEL